MLAWTSLYTGLFWSIEMTSPGPNTMVAPLPWTLVLSTTAPSVFPNLSAQSDGDYLGCRITIDDEVKDEKAVNGVHALIFCLVKSA